MTRPAPPIETPAGFAPAFACGYADAAGRLETVGAASPLPVAVFRGASAVPLEGIATQSGIVGPFAPNGESPVTLALSGEWTGQVALRRSTDGGATLHALRVAGRAWGEFAGNGVEQVWSENDAQASFWLDIALQSGTCAYRVSQ